jgi:hypothetical protein
MTAGSSRTRTSAPRAGALAAWMRALGYLLAPRLVLGGLAFVLNGPVLYLILVVSLFVLLTWVGSASWMYGRGRARDIGSCDSPTRLFSSPSPGLSVRPAHPGSSGARIRSRAEDDPVEPASYLMEEVGSCRSPRSGPRLRG